MTFELGEVIAERELEFVPDQGEAQAVTVRLGRPVPDPRAPDRSWCCPYQILGTGRDRVFAIFGVDALQALLLALHTIPVELAAYVRQHPGKVLCWGAPDTTWLSGCHMAVELAGDVLPGREASTRVDMRFRVDVRQPAPFLRRIMRELAGGALLSLEGDLSSAEFPEQAVASRGPIGLLRRNTIAPPLDFLVLRLEPEFADQIFSQVSRIGLRDRIVHVQIEKSGQLELGAYDNFHAACVVTGGAISAHLLAELRAAGVVREFSSVTQ